MPAMTARLYGKALASFLNKQADLDTDALKWTLHTTSYTPDYDTHQYQSSLAGELSTAGGYTAGGLSAGSLVIATTAANSWGQVYATSTAYTAGQYVRPSTGNGYIYLATTTGSSSGSAPTWPTTIGATVTDSGVTWSCAGRGATTLDCADPSWASFTAGPFRYAILADTTPGSSATNPLICALAFASDQTGGGGTFSITIDASGILIFPY